MFRLGYGDKDLGSWCIGTRMEWPLILLAAEWPVVKQLHYYYYSVVCLTTGPKPLPKRFLHIVRSKASSFKWEYPLLSLRSSSSFLRLLPGLLVTSISPFIFPSITCFRRQFLRKLWPIQLAFRFRISCRIFLCSLTLSNTSHFSHDYQVLNRNFLILLWISSLYFVNQITDPWSCLSIPWRHIRGLEV